MATYRDYEWATDAFGSFCLTWVRAATITEVIDALPVTTDHGEHDEQGLAELTMDSWDRVGDDRLIAGLVERDGFTVLYEINGYLGTLSELMAPVSRGREIVTHHDSIAGSGTFFWYVDGAVRTWFEPLFASERNGTAPDDLIPLMRKVGGYRLTPDDQTRTDFHHKAATFALAHELTGFRITPEILSDSIFRVVEVDI